VLFCGRRAVMTTSHLRCRRDSTRLSWWVELRRRRKCE